MARNLNLKRQLTNLTKPCLVCSQPMKIYKGYDWKKYCSKKCSNKAHSDAYLASLRADPVKRKERYQYTTEMHKVYRSLK
jgi:hypothetical protein